MASDTPTVCVFSPSLLVTVTVESGSSDFDEIHFHMGGQGYWIARMVRELEERPILCAPVGGETGRVIRGLVRSTGFDFSPVELSNASAAYVHDRREGRRDEIAASRSPDLDRHEIDDLFARTLQHSLAAGVCVLTGRRAGDELPVDLYRRLASDLRAAGVRTVGDLHGDELSAFLAGGTLDILKVSDEDLTSDGRLGGETTDDVWAAIDELSREGAAATVVSRGRHGALARFGDARYRVTPPALEVVDPAGAGDSMTAALAVALVRGEEPEESLRLAAAAGAANVTRHGLGSAPVALISRLSSLIDVDRVEG